MISRLHCVVQKENTAFSKIGGNGGENTAVESRPYASGSSFRYYVQDCGSVNGTFVNNQRISKCELKHGDLLIFAGGNRIKEGGCLIPGFIPNSGGSVTAADLERFQKLIMSKYRNSVIIYRFEVSETGIDVEVEKAATAQGELTETNESAAENACEDVHGNPMDTSSICDDPIPGGGGGGGGWCCNNIAGDVDIDENDNEGNEEEDDDDADIFISPIGIKRRQAHPAGFIQGRCDSNEPDSHQLSRLKRQRTGSHSISNHQIVNEDQGSINVADNDNNGVRLKREEELRALQEQIRKEAEELERKRREFEQQLQQQQHQQQQQHSVFSLDLSSADQLQSLSQSQSHSESAPDDKNPGGILRTLDGCEVEKEFICSICQEIILCATTLQCSHTYCRECITQWLRTNRICPTCRKSVSRKPMKNLTLDSIIDKFVKTLSAEEQERRRRQLQEQLEREQVELEPLRNLVNKAKRKGIKFLKVDETWNTKERELFKEGLAKYQSSVARAEYMKLTGLTHAFIETANSHLLRIACGNLGIQVVHTLRNGVAIMDLEATRDRLRDFVDGEL